MHCFVILPNFGIIYKIVLCGESMDIVNYFYNLSNTVLDVVFNIFTFFGSDMFFFILFFIMYWAGNKRTAFKFAGAYYFSVFLNFGLKNLIRKQRPYPMQSDTFAMPSGHAQSFAFVATYNCMEDYRAKKYKTWQKILLPIILLGMCAGVCISRMYFGRHFLSDVIVGSVIGVACAVLFDLLIEKLASISTISLKKFMTAFLLPFAVIIYCLVTFLHIFTAETVIQVYSSVGMFVGVYIGYLLDDKYLKYVASGSSKEMIKKMLLGALIMFTTYYVLLSIITIVYLLPLVFIALGVMGTYVVPLALVKVFQPTIKVEK